jgi:hypothetical protein
VPEIGRHRLHGFFSRSRLKGSGSGGQDSGRGRSGQGQPLATLLDRTAQTLDELHQAKTFRRGGGPVRRETLGFIGERFDLGVGNGPGVVRAFLCGAAMMVQPPSERWRRERQGLAAGWLGRLQLINRCRGIVFYLERCNGPEFLPVGHRLILGGSCSLWK